MRISHYQTTQCPRQAWISADAYRLFMTAIGRVFLLGASLAVIAAMAVFGHLYGRHLASYDVQERDNAIRQLGLESQRFLLEKSSQSANMQAMHNEQDRLQAQLDAIVPSKDRYNIDPNQSLVLADGHLTIGMVGAPRLDGIEINVNGKHQSAAVGDVIRVTPDPSTACDVKIQSFDMFQAQVVASCAEVKTK